MNSKINIVLMLILSSISSFAQEDLKKSESSEEMTLLDSSAIKPLNAKLDTAKQKISGFRLLKIEKGSLYEKIGLKKDDLIKKLNGETISSSFSAQEMNSKINDVKNIELVIERNKKEQVLRYLTK